MNKIEINFELLDHFNEEEINTVCKNTDLTLFLIPIKDKRYAKYAKILGRLDKKSTLVKKLLPGIAFNLYKKGEEPFRAAIATQLDGYREKFVEAISKCTEPPIGVDDVKEYDAKTVADLYFKILDICVANIPVDLFFVFLKLQDIAIDEKTRQSIELEIENIQQEKEREAKHKAEIQDALKEQEKRLSTDFEQQKRDLRKLIEEKSRLYKEIQEKLNAAEQKIHIYENITKTERERREKEWFSEYERRLEARKAADDIQRENALSETEEKHRELLSLLEAEAEKKREELAEQYREQLRTSEEMLVNELTSFRGQVAELTEKKKALDMQVNYLQKRKTGLDSHIQELEAIEEKYFDSFEQRIIDKRIDSLIFQKLGYESSRDNTSPSMTLTIANTSDIVVIPAMAFSKNAEYSADITSIADFFEDYKANISLHFDNETEIAGVVLATVLNGMGVIAMDKVCNYLSEALAALRDASSPLTINISSEKENLRTLADTINESKSHVVCIKGVLDNYNEILFSRICELCKGKYLFFSVSDLKNLKMMSKVMMNYAIVIDAENELHFPVDDYLLIGNHDFKPFIPELDMRKSQDIYKKIFSKLIMNNCIKKSVAIEYSNLLQLYYALVGGTVLGDIIQKGIIYVCEICSEDENLRDVLNKSGITISIE
mgnify:FL=1